MQNPSPLPPVPARPRRFLALAALAAAVIVPGGCSQQEPPPNAADGGVRSAISRQIAAAILATRTKDVDAYLDQIPDGIVLRDEAGEILPREKLREQVQKAWESVIETRALDILIDTIIVLGDSAVVVATQTWDRLVRQPDGAGVDTVISIRHQRELWRRTPRGWLSFDVTPLDGTTTVNGKVYYQ